MSYNLLQHQEEGARFLTTNSAGLLAFEQGLGKTLLAIDGFRRLLYRGAADRMLVVCPISLKRNWLSELSKFATFVSVDIAGGTKINEINEV